MKVLLLEDEESIRGFIRINLKRQGMEVIEADTGEEALVKAGLEGDIQIALLDVMLPTISGFEVCEQLRLQYPRMGIIMLTARSQEADKIRGLELGADDYVHKPFSPGELVARMKALSRRMNIEEMPDREPETGLGPIRFVPEERKLLKHEEEIQLTPTEYAIVKLLLERSNKSVSRDDILTEVWGRHYVGDLKIVDVNIRRLRQKIEEDPSNPVYIHTVWGYGYIWKRDSQP
ncbi:chemotaxis protein CheY [Paenibacillus swuensis]|uniref:Chemotaxis protein CheY n=1 Tax=Paenibacillus swuensis TaxID=1178515 RepID=A0A172THV3_9BACL|nr:response regulator transcription factor [Paenibacillus swuensis]ANE46639.1 chemotaxis protein CheY [Paenibacillus swuensis]